VAPDEENEDVNGYMLVDAIEEAILASARVLGNVIALNHIKENFR
jgi:hypothetical protein